MFEILTNAKQKPTFINFTKHMYNLYYVVCSQWVTEDILSYVLQKLGYDSCPKDIVWSHENDSATTHVIKLTLRYSYLMFCKNLAMRVA